MAFNTPNRESSGKSARLAFLLLALAIPLCAGTAAAETGSAVLTRENLQSCFDEITSGTRGAGTIEEAVYEDALAQRLADAGYTVRFDGFSASQAAVGRFGARNLIAIRKAPSPDADILPVSAHIDSHLCTVGANDDATGAAAVEAIALATARLPTDTELWFVFFSGEEEGLAGSLAFAASLTEDEKYRMIGDIQLDMLGSRFSDGYQLGLPNGDSTLLSDMLQQSAESVAGMTLTLTTEKMSDHVSLAIAGIPSVYFLQNADGYENHSVLDDPSQIDAELYYAGAQIVTDTVLRVMREDSVSLAEEEHARIGDGGLCGRVDPYDDYLDFGTPLNTLESGTATHFSLKSSEINEFGDEQSCYTASVRWFNMDQPLTTEADYYRGSLQEISILPLEQGVSLDEMLQAMTGAMGAPETNDSGDGSVSYSWPWYLGRSYYELSGTADNYRISVDNGYNGNIEIAEIPLADGEPSEALSGSALKLWNDILSKVVQKEDRSAYLSRFLLFTEGLHSLTGYTPAATTDAPMMTLGLDVCDIFDENGQYRNFYRALSTTIHEYGHVLAMNAGQMDLTVETAPAELPPYRADSYMAAYMARFYPEMKPTETSFGDGYYRAHPTDFVSTYASGEPMEDFAESFRCFVLDGAPDEATVAGEKMAFFYEYPVFTEIRSRIRANFDLEG